MMKKMIMVALIATTLFAAISAKKVEAKECSLYQLPEQDAYWESEEDIQAIDYICEKKISNYAKKAIPFAQKAFTESWYCFNSEWHQVRFLRAVLIMSKKLSPGQTVEFEVPSFRDSESQLVEVTLLDKKEGIHLERINSGRDYLFDRSEKTSEPLGWAPIDWKRFYIGCSVNLKI